MAKVSSILRYPGGKSRKVKEILDLLGRGAYLFEPFFGGGSVGLQALQEFPPGTVMHFNDYDPRVYDLWRQVFQEPQELIELIANEPYPTLTSFYAAKEGALDSNPGYKFLFLNRTSFSGLGANPIGGKSQSSKWDVGCRWNADRLIKNIEKIHKLSKYHTVVVTNLDFEETLKSAPPNAVVYLDPPYYEKGPELYRKAFTPEHHQRLAQVLKLAQYEWLLSYDNHEVIRNLYEYAKVFTSEYRYSINGSKDSWETKTELYIRKK